MEFKVGDRVRVKDDSISAVEINGLVGWIRAVQPECENLQFYRVAFASGLNVVTLEENLEADKPAEESFGSSDEQPDVRFPAFQEDNVNHPQHYKHGEIETLDIIRMSLTPEEFQGFLKGNVLKYQLRAPFKHATPDEDYKKAKYYYDEYREVTE